MLEENVNESTDVVEATSENDSGEENKKGDIEI